MDYVLYQNRIIPKNELHIDMDDRGYNFGDGIYEVVRVYNGIPFAMDEHLDRLQHSASELDMTVPYSMETIEKLVYDLIQKNEINSGMIYFQLTRGIQPRNHLYSRDIEPVLSGFSKPLETNVEWQQNGLDTWMTKDIRWLRCDIKTINLLGNIMAKREASDNNCHEALQHREGLVTEGSSSNLFIVKDDVIYTHPSTNLILNGITRRITIRLAYQIEATIKEKPFTLEELKQADEVFITSTTMEVTPVRSIKGDLTASYSIGPWTRKLQHAFTDYRKKQQ
ncbi:D-amino-acid transaminase [Alkalihalobacterium chitinilyticum]|uniref:D-alanine aminotransferase n=1 Tax=Alkalihalobacterium chitinilyticum TaxID=2980103 RepID=A0ABT5V9Y2_9BACI|nr:D-amino-acid transaminase [Alkalihalobacterium chitinilyticum]MDE5412268.1 D-amino-acid transaminase [Alkalihalobacterium chitinilyticum]